MTVHFITGGTDHEQQREGDYLTKDERYERTGECMQIVKKAWTSREPFDHTGRHYKFADFVSDVFPVQQPRPRLSFGGSSPAAYAAGGAEADIYCLWGEPLARTAEQIESVRRAAKDAGRTDTPKIQVAFRPIIAPTEERAWEKAHDIVARIESRVQAGGGALTRRRSVKNPASAFGATASVVSGSLACFGGALILARLRVWRAPAHPGRRPGRGAVADQP
jgi:alkanesulfonate monooxygenase